jgi:hypothetical protein
MLVLSGLHSSWNYIHAGASGSFLTGTPRGGRNEIEIFADVSIDQLMARRFSSETQVASLEMSMDAPPNAGACTGNLSCVYTHTLSWRSPLQPLPMEYNPRAVFERLFGDTGKTDWAAREARMLQHKSILDSVSEKLSSLKRELGSQDQTKINEYTEAIRDVERRIQKAEEQRDNLAAVDGGAPRRTARIRGSSGIDVRPAASRVSVGSDSRHHVHDRKRAERSTVSAGRRSRAAPSAVSSRQRARVDRQDVQDQPVSYRAVLETTGETARDAGR